MPTKTSLNGSTSPPPMIETSPSAPSGVEITAEQIIGSLQNEIGQLVGRIHILTAHNTALQTALTQTQAALENTAKAPETKAAQ